MRLLKHGNLEICLIALPHHSGGVNACLLEHKGGLTLIDTGNGSEESWEMFCGALNEAGYSIFDIDRVLITHHHGDHVGLLQRLEALREIPVYAHPLAIPGMRRDPAYMRMRIDFFRNLYHEMGCGDLGEDHIGKMRSLMKENGHLRTEGAIHPLVPEASPPIAGLEPIYSPGHAPDHLMYVDRAGKVLFAGDHVLPNINSNALVEPDSDGRRLPTLVMYYRSLQSCRELDAELVLPGHGEPFRNLREVVDRKLSHIDKKVQKMLSLISDKPVTAFELAQRYYPTEYRRQFSLVMSSVIGSLDFLENEGRVAKFRKNGIWRYTSG